MVAIKTLAISTLCVVGMANAQLLGSLFDIANTVTSGITGGLTGGLTNAVDNTNYPAAFAQVCNSNNDIINANNKLLGLYFARGGACLPAHNAEINKQYTCPAGAVGYASSVAWTPEFDRLKGQQAKIRAQSACLTYFATGRA